MGGWGSGRTGGQPTADMSKRIDLAWMLREEKAIAGQWVRSSLSWTCGGTPAGSIGYVADMTDPHASELRLSFSRGSGESREQVEQTVRLTFTEPHFGGRRWWMVCPYSGRRMGKLYLPNGGDRFASREAWRLGYHSQRVAARDRPFEKLFQLQRKLGCEQGYDSYIRKPKGMWQRTFERHLERFNELDELCGVEMATMVLRLGGDR